MTRSTCAGLVLGWTLGLGAGCAEAGPGADRGGSLVVRDSSGIEIVENVGSVWDAPPRWTVGAEPDLRVGAVDGDEEYLFDGIAGIAVLSDGRFVVANRGDNMLRWYGPDGVFLFQRGGTGEGPGEYSRFSAPTVAPGDTLVVADWAARRISVLDAEGSLVETVGVVGLLGPPGSAFRVGAGGYAVGISGSSSEQLSGDVEFGRMRHDTPIVRVSGTPPTADTIGMFPGDEIEIRAMGTSWGFGPPNYGRRLAYHGTGDLLVVGTGETFRFDFYRSDGVLERSVRVPDEDLALSPERIEAYKDWLRGRNPDLTAQQRAELEESIEGMTFPAEVPPYSGLDVAPDGSLWVREYEDYPGEVSRWARFAVHGAFQGIVELPGGFVLMDIRGDRVFGRLRDEFGVEYVAAYRVQEVPG